MNVEKSYPGAEGALMNDIWVYGLNVVNPTIEINGASLQSSKFEYNDQVICLLKYPDSLIDFEKCLFIFKIKVLKMRNLELVLGNGIQLEIKTQRN